ncbi:MAG: type II toxin-antitoxin system VapC family toxin [Chroococcales cyanobacterium]
MSSVNWAEVMQKSVAAGVEVDGLLHDLQALGLRIEPFTVEDGEMTGRLWEQTRQAGLSLGDRACLSLGLRLGVPVLICDRAWASLSLSVKIQAIRSDVCHRIAPLISKPKITNAID